MYIGGTGIRRGLLVWQLQSSQASSFASEPVPSADRATLISIQAKNINDDAGQSGDGYSVELSMSVFLNSA